MFVVVTLAAVFVAYHVNWVRQRRAAHAGADWYRIYFDQEWFVRATPKPRAPGVLWLFGERGHHQLLLSFGREPAEGFYYYNRELTPLELAEVNRIKRLFPEARVETKAKVADPPQSSSR